jgi:Pyruvate/2-oxoacid:ferredoxin oxidoreductase delta subunit
VPVLFLAAAFCGAAAAFAGWIYQVDRDLCIGCGMCVYWCPEGAIIMQGNDAWIDPAKCNGCGVCVPHCPPDAIFRTWWEEVEAPPGDPQVRVFPNPSTGYVFATGLPDGMLLTAYDDAGRQVADGSVLDGSACLDLSGLSSGVIHLMLCNRLLGSVALIRP